MSWFCKAPEPKQEHESGYEPPIETVLYDEEGYELAPDIWGGGYHRKVDEKPVEEDWPPIWSK